MRILIKITKVSGKADKFSEEAGLFSQSRVRWVGEHGHCIIENTARTDTSLPGSGREVQRGT
jgi:hypothetical protein